MNQKRSTGTSLYLPQVLQWDGSGQVSGSVHNVSLPVPDVGMTKNNYDEVSTNLANSTRVYAKTKGAWMLLARELRHRATRRRIPGVCATSTKRRSRATAPRRFVTSETSGRYLNLDYPVSSYDSAVIEISTQEQTAA